MAFVGTVIQNAEDFEPIGDFAKLYLQNLDKCQNKFTKLYMDNARLVWNGNCMDGSETITKFYKNLPICGLKWLSVDTQRVLSESVNHQPTVLVLVAGAIKLHEKPWTPFQQNFVLAVHNNNWKVVSECFRFQETVPFN